MRYLILCLLLTLATTLTGKTVELKGANGRFAQFQIESIGPEGIEAIPGGSHRSMLLKWEQLDLNWLANNRPNIWKKKQQIDRMASAAFKGFFFKEDQNSVYQKIRQMGGVRVSGEPFGDSDPNAVWVTLDPKNYSKFLRLSFNNQRQLVGMEVHQNFSSKTPIERNLKSEWERMAGMVDEFYIPVKEDNGFPSRLDWRRFTNRSSSEKESALLTRRWEDAQRRIELSLTSKSVRMEGPLQATGKTTLFGVEMRPSSALPSENTYWLIYSAKLK